MEAKNKKIELQRKQEILDEEYYRETKENEELLDELTRERRQFDIELDDLFNSQRYYVNELNEDFDNSHQVMHKIDQARDEFDGEFRHIRLNVEDRINESEVDYRRKKNRIDEELLEE